MLENSTETTADEAVEVQTGETVETVAETDDFYGDEGEGEFIEIPDESEGTEESGDEPAAEENDEKEQTQTPTGQNDAPTGENAPAAAETKLAANESVVSAADSVRLEIEELRRQLEDEKAKNTAAVQSHTDMIAQLGFESEAALRAHLEGVSVEMILERDEAQAKKAEPAAQAEKVETAKPQAEKPADDKTPPAGDGTESPAATGDAGQADDFGKWARSDIDEILKAHPTLKIPEGKGFLDLLDDPQKFIKMREDPAIRERMTAAETFEFINRGSLAQRQAAAASRATASKDHLKAGKARSVTPSVSMPRDLYKIMKNTYPNMSDAEILKHYKKTNS